MFQLHQTHLVYNGLVNTNIIIICWNDFGHFVAVEWHRYFNRCHIKTIIWLYSRYVWHTNHHMILQRVWIQHQILSSTWRSNIYDKQDDFNFRIVISPFIRNKTSQQLKHMVYYSLHDTRTWVSFLYYKGYFFNKLLKQGFLIMWLMYDFRQ